MEIEGKRACDGRAVEQHRMGQGDRLDRWRRFRYRGSCEEVVRIVSETGKKMRSNMERVLRAMDVIPPFEEESINGGPWRRSPERTAVPKEPDLPSPPDDAARHIPTLDLGEKILAEQRRMTARKRKAPGSAHVEPSQIQPPPAVILRAERAVEPSAQDVIQLEQLVAEIVARDINRLCAGPARMSL
jgi:hypothetical protein